MEDGSYKRLCPTEAPGASEERTVPPVASVGMFAFHLMVEGAVDSGYISDEAVPHIMFAYSQVDRG